MNIPGKIYIGSDKLNERWIKLKKSAEKPSLLRIIAEYENDDRIADYDSSRTKVMKRKFAYH